VAKTPDPLDPKYEWVDHAAYHHFIEKSMEWQKALIETRQERDSAYEQRDHAQKSAARMSQRFDPLVKHARQMRRERNQCQERYSRMRRKFIYSLSILSGALGGFVFYVVVSIVA
jgi:uncharacterized coiled-coil DUF342 family protein